MDDLQKKPRKRKSKVKDMFTRPKLEKEDNHGYVPSPIEIKEPPIPRPARAEIISHQNPYAGQIWMYTGSMKRISIGKVLFPHEVPIYVNEALARKLKGYTDFVEYTPVKGALANEHPILVIMPKFLDYFVASMLSLGRIKEAYPSTQIHVLCNPEYKKALPCFVKYIDSYSRKDTFYKEYNLTENAIENYWLNDWNRSIAPLHILILKSTGLFRIGKDENVKPYIEGSDPGDYDLLIHMDCDLNIDIEKVLPATGIKYVHLNDINESDVIGARRVVALCDNRVMLLAGYMNKKTMALIDDKITKRQIQLKAYGIDVFSYPIEADYGEAVAKIREFIHNGRQHLRD